MSADSKTANHTPGPWVVEACGACIQVAQSPDHPAIAEMWLRGNRDQELANARLIAAAPDLLAALQELAEIVQGALDDTNLHGLGMDSFTLQPARLAIAKALGERGATPGLEAAHNKGETDA